MGLKSILIKEGFIGVIDDLIKMATKKLTLAGKSALKNNLDTLLRKAADDTEKLDILIGFVKTNSKEFGDDWVNQFAGKYINGLEPAIKKNVDDIEILASTGKIDETKLRRLLADRNAGLMKDADPDTIDLVFDYLKTFIKKTTPSGGGTADDYASLFNSMVGKTDSQIDDAVKKGYEDLKNKIQLEISTSVGDNTKKGLLEQILKEIEDLQAKASRDLTPTEVVEQTAKIQKRVNQLPEGNGFKRWWQQFKKSGAGKFGGKILNWAILLSILAVSGTLIYINFDKIKSSVSGSGGDDGAPYNKTGPRETGDSKSSDSKSDGKDIDWSEYAPK